MHYYIRKHVCAYYMCSILTKQSACRQLLVYVLLFYLVEQINANI